MIFLINQPLIGEWWWVHDGEFMMWWVHESPYPSYTNHSCFLKPWRGRDSVVEISPPRPWHLPTARTSTAMRWISTWRRTGWTWLTNTEKPIETRKIDGLMMVYGCFRKICRFYSLCFLMKLTNQISISRLTRLIPARVQPPPAPPCKFKMEPKNSNILQCGAPQL